MKEIHRTFRIAMANLYEHLVTSYVILPYLMRDKTARSPFQDKVNMPVRLHDRYKLFELDGELLNSFLESEASTRYFRIARRQFLADLVSIYERCATAMIASHKNGRVLTDPSKLPKSEARSLQARHFEELPQVLTAEQKTWLSQLRRLRNSLLHYDGLYNFANELDYTLGSQRLVSKGREGTPIDGVDLEALLWIYGQTSTTFESACDNYWRYYSDAEED